MPLVRDGSRGHVWADKVNTLHSPCTSKQGVKGHPLIDQHRQRNRALLYPRVAEVLYIDVTPQSSIITRGQSSLPSR